MGFLFNDGDIILDAVLTDSGRSRLAKGDGTFKISKFALGDDEINYGLYDKNHTSGSAYYDLTVLQTPVLEAFTNNNSSLKSKLMTVQAPGGGLLYLPVFKLNTDGNSVKHSDGIFVVPSDKTTIDKLGKLAEGVLNGYKPNDSKSHISVHQGLDTNQLSKEDVLARELIETQYIVELDHRLGRIYAPPQSPQAKNTRLTTDTQIAAATPSFVDKDNIASYYFTLKEGGGYVTNLGATEGDANIIRGPRGTQFNFRLGGSLDIKTSNYLFSEIGSLGTSTFTNTGGTNLDASTWRYIDSTIRVTGVSTGFRLDIPVRFIKLIIF